MGRDHSGSRGAVFPSFFGALARIGSLREAVVALLLALAPSLRAGSIFDDDWTPPRRAEPTVAWPATRPKPAVPTPLPRDPATPGNHVAPPKPEPNPIVASAPGAAAGRRPVPPAAERDKARRLMKDVFAKDLEDRSPTARKVLAHKLLDEAAKITNAPTDQYVVLGGAIQSAAEAGDLPLAFEAADRTAEAFDVDATALKANVAMKVPPKAYAAGAAEDVPAALGLAGELESEEDFAAAANLVAFLKQVSFADPSLRAAVVARGKVIEEARAARERLGPALEKLKAAPDDPGANGAVGRYTVFVRGDWERGLPLLAKGDAPKLAALAKAALADPADADARAKLADGWWEMAQTSAGGAKTVLLARSAEDYRLASPELAGLRRVVAEKRIAEADAAVAAAGAAGAAGAAAGRGGVVHLLPLVDDRDLIRAEWSRQGAAIVSHAHDQATLTLPYLPPAEFDFSAEFSRLSGEGDIVLVCPVGTGTCDFSIGADRNRRAVLGKINGKWTDHPSAVNASVPNNERHRMEVKVRRDGVEGYLDGKRLCAWQTNGDDLGGHRFYAARSPGLLAVGSYRSQVAFHAIDVTPVHGGGVVVRQRDADGWPYNPTALRPSADGVIRLSSRDATVHGKKLVYEGEPDRRCLGSWDYADEYATWFIEAPAAGDYAVEVTYSCETGDAGSDVAVGLGPAAGGPAAAPLTLHVAGTGSWGQFRTDPVGNLHLPAGRQTLSVKPTDKPHGHVMNLRQVTLTPVH